MLCGSYVEMRLVKTLFLSRLPCADATWLSGSVTFPYCESGYHRRLKEEELTTCDERHDASPDNFCWLALMHMNSLAAGGTGHRLSPEPHINVKA